MTEFSLRALVAATREGVETPSTSTPPKIIGETNLEEHFIPKIARVSLDPSGNKPSPYVIAVNRSNNLGRFFVTQIKGDE